MSSFMWPPTFDHKQFIHGAATANIAAMTSMNGAHHGSINSSIFTAASTSSSLSSSLRSAGLNCTDTTTGSSPPQASSSSSASSSAGPTGENVSVGSNASSVAGSEYSPTGVGTHRLNNPIQQQQQGVAAHSTNAIMPTSDAITAQAAAAAALFQAGLASSGGYAPGFQTTPSDTLAASSNLLKGGDMCLSGNFGSSNSSENGGNAHSAHGNSIAESNSNNLASFVQTVSSQLHFGAYGTSASSLSAQTASGSSAERLKPVNSNGLLQNSGSYSTATTPVSLPSYMNNGTHYHHHYYNAGMLGAAAAMASNPAAVAAATMPGFGFGTFGAAAAYSGSGSAPQSMGLPNTAAQSSCFSSSAMSPANAGLHRISGGIAKKKPHPVPVEQKTPAYYERRKKNNDSARRSREIRRMKEDENQRRNGYLEQECQRLQAENRQLAMELLSVRNAYNLVMGHRQQQQLASG